MSEFGSMSDRERTVKNARAVLACFRTPHLRNTLASLLTEGGGQQGRVGPLRQIPWILDNGHIDTPALNADIARLEELLSPLSVVGADPTPYWPERHEDRFQLVSQIFDRIFSGGARKQFLSEAEVNAALGVLVTDVPRARRFAVDFGIVRRKSDGSAYWRPDSS